MKTLREIFILFNYYIKISLKSPIWVLVAMFQPVCYLFFYAPLLESFSRKAGMQGGEALTVFIPGLLVMVAFFGSMFVGFAMVDDIKSGMIERMRVLPISNASMLIARGFRDAITLLVQSIILLALAIPLGLQVAPLGTFFVMSIMLLVGLFMSSISYGLALTLKTEDAVGSIINFFAQPMLLLSGVLIPLIYAPKWLQVLSSVNPLKYVVDACRELFVGHLYNTQVIIGTFILFALVIVSMRWCIRSYNKVLQ